MAARLTARPVLPALSFGVPMIVYLLTASPDLTWAHYGADGGDLVTAAYTLGVPHPPGYPTYTSLAWLFTRMPLGSVAWRVNLLSAASTAAAAALIYWTVTRLAARADPPRPDGGKGAHAAGLAASSGPASVAGLGAAWAFAFVPLVWSQALIAEVYGLAGLWTALILVLTLLFRHRRWGAGFTLGLIWSLGLGVHYVLVFLVPVVVWAVWHSFRPTGRLWGSWSWVILGFLSGLSAWLYLPLRAGQGGITWGQPTTWEGFWWMVSGSLYRDYLFALPPAAAGERLAAWAREWVDGLGPGGLGLATLGVIWLARRRRGWLIAIGLSWAALNLYAMGYDTADSVVYLVPAFVVGSVWLGVGLAGLLRQLYLWIHKSRWWAPLALTLALATPVWMLLRNAAALDLSDDHTTLDFCEVALREAPTRAVLLTTTDRQTFALWYCQRVEGLRTDVAVVDEGLVGFEWYRAGLQRAHADLWGDPLEAQGPIDLSAERTQCRVHREAQAGWLDCRSSKTD